MVRTVAEYTLEWEKPKNKLRNKDLNGKIGNHSKQVLLKKYTEIANRHMKRCYTIGHQGNKNIKYRLAYDSG